MASVVFLCITAVIADTSYFSNLNAHTTPSLKYLLQVRSGNSHGDAKGDGENIEPLSLEGESRSTTASGEGKSNIWIEKEEEMVEDEVSKGTHPLTVDDVLRKLRRVWNQKQFVHPGGNSSQTTLSASDGPISSRMLFDQILQQLQHPAQWAGGKLWLDQDFALSLRGLAVLAQHPQLLQSQGKATPIPTRAVSPVLRHPCYILSSNHDVECGRCGS